MDARHAHVERVGANTRDHLHGRGADSNDGVFEQPSADQLDTDPLMRRQFNGNARAVGDHCGRPDGRYPAIRTAVVPPSRMTTCPESAIFAAVRATASFESGATRQRLRMSATCHRAA
jgi:hypothetical protein